jgi:hypothetical protein
MSESKRGREKEKWTEGGEILIHTSDPTAPSTRDGLGTVQHRLLGVAVLGPGLVITRQGWDGSNLDYNQPVLAGA